MKNWLDFNVRGPINPAQYSEHYNCFFRRQPISRHVNDYRKTSYIRGNLVGNKIAGHSDAVGASPAGAAPTTSSFSTWHLASRDSAKKAARQYENL